MSLKDNSIHFVQKMFSNKNAIWRVITYLHYLGYAIKKNNSICSCRFIFLLKRIQAYINCVILHKVITFGKIGLVFGSICINKRGSTLFSFRDKMKFSSSFFLHARCIGVIVLLSGITVAIYKVLVVKTLRFI